MQNQQKQMYKSNFSTRISCPLGITLNFIDFFFFDVYTNKMHYLSFIYINEAFIGC